MESNSEGRVPGMENEINAKEGKEGPGLLYYDAIESKAGGFSIPCPRRKNLRALQDERGSFFRVAGGD